MVRIGGNFLEQSGPALALVLQRWRARHPRNPRTRRGNTDLKVLAFTDHDCITGALQAHRLASAYGLEVAVSQEVTTARGHLLALFIESLIPAGLSIPETVERVHAQGGVAILAHPFDRVCNSPMRHWPRPTMADWRSFQLDGLEAINGAQIDPTANPRSMALVRTLGLAQTGGSDAHHKEVIGVAHTCSLAIRR
jgi:predicted metal-dependent phosphoesterase TrpH